MKRCEEPQFARVNITVLTRLRVDTVHNGLMESGFHDFGGLEKIRVVQQSCRSRETSEHAREGRRVHRTSVFLPYVEAGCCGERREVASCPRDRAEPLSRYVRLVGLGEMLTERPQPRAVAVDLKVRPVINDGRAIERKARGRHDRWIQDLTAQHLLDDVVDDSANAADGIVYPRVIQ